MSAAAEDPAPTGGRRLEQLANISVATLRGVGTKKAAALEQMGLVTVLDLLMHYPRRYADQTNAASIDELVPGDEVWVSGTVVRVNTRRPRGGRAIVELVVEDETGRLRVTFFNQPWRSRQLSPETGVALFGKVSDYRGQLQIANPKLNLVGDQTGGIVPIYSQSEKAGVGSTELATFVREALERAGHFADPLADSDRRSLALVDRTTAFADIHAPTELWQVEPAKRRLKFDELFRLQVALVLRKRAAAAAARGIAHLVEADGTLDLVGRFLDGLPFELTHAQRRVIAEIAADLGASLPMHRLLQGDVGAGKTVVALAALLYAVQGGYEGALMVPTEVLAEQHYLAARSLLSGLMIPDATRLMGERPLSVALLTSRTTQAERTRLLSGLRQGHVDILVGTHALLTEEVRFKRLGVVVIDEQHRFGVDQRAALREKGSIEEATPSDPDLLVMTATPIPRTAAMTVYGDLDYSVLDELPAGRGAVRTVWIQDDADEARAWEKVRAEVEAGRQAFVVCPLVRPGEDEEHDEEDEVPEEEELSLFPEAPPRPARAAVSEFERLRGSELEGVAVGLLHGQLNPKEKEATMTAFRAGELSVLVATTVIEVGVDVPQATVMVIEDADRFGIAQLHQLRGRVGRGKSPGFCYLLGSPRTDLGARRLAALEQSSDGFELAEVDLDLRGEGTVLGARQRGRSDLRLASLRHDRDLIESARDVAERTVNADPPLEHHRLLREELELFVGEEAGVYLERS